MRIFLTAQDDLDWSPLALPLMLVERRQDVLGGEGVEVVLGGQPILGQPGVDEGVRDVRFQWRLRIKCQRGRNVYGDWPGWK